MKKRKKDSDLKENVVFNIQSIIMSVLMAITLVTIVTMGFLLYQRFKLARRGRQAAASDPLSAPRGHSARLLAARSHRA